MFLFSATFLILSLSKSMFANVNFCNHPQAGQSYRMGIMGMMGTMKIIGTMHYSYHSYCSHYSHSSHKKSFAHHYAAVRKNFTIFAVQTDLKPPVGVRGLG